MLTALLVPLLAAAPARPAPPAPAPAPDLAEASVAQLQAGYAAHRLTVTEVVRRHLARLHRYDGVYQAVQTPLDAAALARAAEEDAEARRPGFRPGPLWGVPVVVKANMSVAGEVTTAGWRGFALPRHRLVAPRDATVVARLRAAGAVIVGITNMPDFAASDTTRSTAFGRTGNAYDVRFSPGGSSGGTVTAVAAGLAVLGTGTDTGNSIRMPAATSGLVGVFPTRGLVSTAGIVPMDALLDNAGPIARRAADAAAALTAMAGEDPLDPATLGSAAKAQPGPYTRYLVAGALRGRRFGVPAFVMAGRSHVFQGVCPGTPPALAAKAVAAADVPLAPETRAAFGRALDALRAAGATIVATPDVMPAAALADATAACTTPYLAEGQDRFLAAFGTPELRSIAAYRAATGGALPAGVAGTPGAVTYGGLPMPAQRRLADDPAAERTYLAPRRAFLARYLAELDRLRLDGFVYPAIQMPPVDETMPQDGQVSGGPHSATAWVNVIGVPAVAVPAGFYASGLPFGIEFSARPWRDGDLIGWAYDCERLFGRRPPVLVGAGLLPGATGPLEPAGRR